MLIKNRPLFVLSLILILGVFSSCRSKPILILSKKYSVTRYNSPSREPNLNILDYSCVFITKKNSDKFKITKVFCNNEESKLYLLDSNNSIVTDFNKNDTLLLRASILRSIRPSKVDTLTLYYEIHGREKKIQITNFIKVEIPINQ